MAIGIKKIEGIMLFHAQHLNTSNAPVTRDTVLGEALSAKVVVSMSSRLLFKTLTRRDILINGGSDKAWPANWPEQTIAALAPQLA